MKNNQYVTRIVLEEKAQAALSSMLETLKLEGESLKAEGKYLKINSSKLASWILLAFKEEFFLQKKADILQDHFNFKEYLKSLVVQIENSEDAEKFLLDAIKQINPKRFPKSRARSRIIKGE